MTFRILQSEILYIDGDPWGIVQICRDSGPKSHHLRSTYLIKEETVPLEVPCEN
jgi:hypothetical protein